MGSGPRRGARGPRSRVRFKGQVCERGYATTEHRFENVRLCFLKCMSYNYIANVRALTAGNAIVLLVTSEHHGHLASYIASLAGPAVWVWPRETTI